MTETLTFIEALDEAEDELLEAQAEVCAERNGGSGQPSLQTVDRLTDAVDAFMLAFERVRDRLVVTGP